MLHRRLLVALPLVVAGGVLYLLSGCTARARAEETPHRALRAALYHMKEAKEEFKDERLERHREKIERDLKAAIREIEGALREAKIDVKYEPSRGWDEKYKSFRHLRQAMAELDEAREAVSKEKGEWARRRELKEAIEDARQHLEEVLKDIK
jgi:hypothetical protein